MGGIIDKFVLHFAASFCLFCRHSLAIIIILRERIPQCNAGVLGVYDPLVVVTCDRSTAEWKKLLSDGDAPQYAIYLQ